MRFFATLAVAASLITASVGQTQGLSILNPGPGLWWIADSLNTLAWTCQTSPYQTYTVMVSNPNTTLLSGPLAIISILQNADCSETINLNALPAGQGYIVALASTLNDTDYYASASFEVRAAGSAYPPQSTPPTSSKSNSTASASGAAPTNTKSAGFKSVSVAGSAMLAMVGLGVSVLAI